ncbi:MAG: trypsin-like serine protease with C-terminal PDZ domain [Candidatus Saganbacteria bacterium]|uniref:Trypsin-like serine protease with C-terminal PDZ domain n=1 Tax=Candidatus Saganbacteria bacterium TaxID=2575572 RepID=A0A833L059_UNCSA|nr:MAG: trypsin-like serine protease with C-terminal PDZ domain [Candidatus Saganbacteria bacterium]
MKKFKLTAIILFLFLSVTSYAQLPTSNNLNFIADIAEKVGSAVVNLDVIKMERSRVFNPFKDFGFGFEIEPEFRNFFEDKLVPIKGAGSGFIIDKEGHIFTNEHVVNGSDKIKVTLKDGRSFEGKVVGSDASIDLAIVKIEASDLPILNLGDSSIARPGEWVIAIGNPYGFSNTVTAGIISATGRTLADIGKKDLIQTDAAINPGNSGGPLINVKGEAIGINTAIVAQAQGIGFAIPINSAKEIKNDLITKGKVIRPWLGVYMRDIDEKIKNYLGLPISEGILITDVFNNSPAEKMGFKQYDVIKEINGEKVSKSDDAQKIIQKMKPGNLVKFIIYRDGKNYSVSGKLSEKPK